MLSKKANEIFPMNLLIEIQKYAEGCTIYIPKKDGNRKVWGTETKAKTYILERNKNIKTEYKNGKSLRELNNKYFLSIYTLKKIIYTK